VDSLNSQILSYNKNNFKIVKKIKHPLQYLLKLSQEWNEIDIQDLKNYSKMTLA